MPKLDAQYGIYNPVTFDGFGLGIANIPRDTDLPDGALSDAVNVDIDNTGNVYSRRGITLKSSGIFKSLWSHPSISYGLCSKNGVLNKINSGGELTSLSVSVGNPIYYTLHNNAVHYITPTSRGMVIDGSHSAWGLSVPAAPTVTAGTGGGFSAGEYMVGCVYVDSNGMESGCSLLTSVTLADNGLISLSSIPSSTYRVRVYITPTNGDVLYSSDTISVGVTSWSLGLTDPGKQLTTEFMGPPPDGGSAICSYRGRVYVAKENIVYFSEAGAPHLFHRLQGYFQHPENITLMAPSLDGIYIASSKRTWFRQMSDPTAKDANLSLVSNFGAVPMNPILMPTSAFMENATQQGFIHGWFDSQGDLCIGRPQGMIQQPLRGRFRASKYRRGSGVFCVNQENIEQLMFLGGL